MVDKDGYFLIHTDKTKEWGRYLNHKQDISSEISAMKEDVEYFSLEDCFKNGEYISLALKPKISYIEKLKRKNFSYISSLGILVVVISIPLAIIMAFTASNMQKTYTKVYRDNLRYMDTIDKYVITMRVGLNQELINVSKALCETSGYTKEELIGKRASIFKSGNVKDEVYQDLWETISNGEVWVGELEDKKKNQEPFWLKTTIFPDFEDEEIISYTAVSEDITDKKVIEYISEHDKLTQIYNRVKLDEYLEREMSRFQRYKDKFSVIMIDIDYFKSVNDEYGHQVGDSVLVEVSNILQKNIRSKLDIVGRWGGEEFLVICMGTDIYGAEVLAEHLRAKIENFKFSVIKNKTASFGIAQVTDNDDIESVLKRADEALYKAKRNGRNQVVST
jgi:diguanylate cyclase (GGDEF)-like protein/PAS domain S-box-containing protein